VLLSINREASFIAVDDVTLPNTGFDVFIRGSQP